MDLVVGIYRVKEVPLLLIYGSKQSGKNCML